MNKKQKYVLIIALILIILTVIIWISTGSEIFTKTQILVEKKDELFGWTEKQWVKKFVLVLDLTLLIDFVTIIASTIFFFIFRRKNKRN